MKNTVKIGTRGSKLALWQANWVQSELQKKNPDLCFEIEVIKTKGDKILDVPLAKVGGKGLFVKEIEQALLDGNIDLAVHSMKDMPAEIPDGLCIGAVPLRENVNDVLISQKGICFSDLPEKATVGTSSLRRSSQLLNARQDIVIVPLRGNLNTRLKKLESGGMDAIVVAAAGVKRLGFEDKITQYFDNDTMLPAVGQGALCIEIREQDKNITQIVDELDHYHTRIIVLGERAFLHRLEGGCQVPIAAHGQIKENVFTLTGLVASVDGKTVIKNKMSGDEENSKNTGIKLAESLLAAGARELLESLKENINDDK